MNPVITQAEAEAAGLKRFFTGEPCARAHIAERFVSNRGCVECNNERRANNLEKIREQARYGAAVYRSKDRGKVREQGRRSAASVRARDPEKAREKDRRKRANNIERFREKDRRAEISRRLKKVKESLGVDQALQPPEASGSILDLKTAINVFKSHDNAFEFIEHIPDVVESVQDFIGNLPKHG